MSKSHSHTLKKRFAGQVFSRMLKILENPAFYLAFRRLISRDYRTVKSILRREKHVWGGERCLDLPCGVGDMSQFLDGNFYVGLDLSKRYIAYAKRHFRSEFIVGDARQLPFGKSTFDRVISIALFHHLTEEGFVRISEEIAGVLRQGGIFIAVDAVTPVSKLAFLQRMLLRLDRGKHVRSLDQCNKLFLRVFTIVRKYTFTAWPYRYCLFVLTKG